MTIVYSLFSSFTGTFLSQITPDNPLQESHADRTLFSTSAPQPPVASIVDPNYLNELVHGIGTPAKQTHQEFYQCLETGANDIGIRRGNSQ